MLGRLLMTAGRAYPFVRGRMRFFLTFVLRKKLADVLAKMANPTPMRRGFSLFTYEREFTSLWLRMWGDLEPETRAMILENLPPGTAFLDAGANVGIFSVGIAHARPDVTVHAFEPNPHTAALLRRSLAFNRIESRVQVHEVALSDTPGELAFYDNQDNAGDSHLVGEHEEITDAAHIVKVPVRALDQFAEFLARVKTDGKRIACMKMDIQGAEVQALRGMRGFLREHRPAIIVEATDDSLCRFGCNVGDLRGELESQGYAIERQQDHNLIARPRP
jgi:FkbM family methyltransferase